MKKSIFEIKEDDEPRVNPKHLVYCILSWIAYIDDEYKIYKTLKVRNYKYPVRMYWISSKLKYRNAKFIYR